MTTTVTCEHCETKFLIEYDDTTVDASLTYCAFCGEYIVESSNALPNVRGFFDDEGTLVL